VGSGDFEGDLFDDRVIGIPAEDVEGAVDAGQVFVA
jgi:hypothetical protein